MQLGDGLRAFSRHGETCEIYSQWESRFSISWLWTDVCFQKILLLLSRGALGRWVCEYRGPDTGLGVFLCSPGYTGDGERRSVWRWDRQLTATGSERKGGIKNDSYFPSWVYDLHVFRSERVWKWEHILQETWLIYLFILTYSTHLFVSIPNEQVCPSQSLA